MVDVLQIGPILIRFTWLYFMISAIFGFYIMRYVLQRKSPHNLHIIDVLSTSGVLALLIWKIGPAVANPLLLTSPMSLIIYPGTPFSTRLALVIVLMYLIYTIWRRQMKLMIVLDTIVIGWIASSLVFQITHWQYGLLTTVPWGISISNPDLRYHPTNVYKLFLLIPLVWKMNKPIFGQGEIGYTGLLGYGLICLLVSFFEPKLTVWLGLSKEQIMAGTIFLVGFIAMFVIQYPKSLSRT
ncbi:hypothetical protein BK120_23620 [Paenibacillus sp. FSL A5-0031]|uniref:hypothetical protein n=1 Tax=Paenibacillus sp. FSL A5-0031 TaxID=1920420 RepID=UPI00096C0D17|nr:hypothetical protein [Paenibacillus sp. FSL A5-0031]OME78724.1 hypothetical protein BK120_23620 [Paenibacillus sp. FSL A5-0031]